VRNNQLNIRPIAVTVIAAHNFVGAAFLLYVWVQLFGIDLARGETEYATGDLKTIYNVLLFALPLSIGVSLALGIGLLYLQNWARVAAIVFYLLGAALTLVSMAITNSPGLSNLWVAYATVALGITFSIILSAQEVAQAFR
jgi:hypothetical protein